MGRKPDMATFMANPLCELSFSITWQTEAKLKGEKALAGRANPRKSELGSSQELLRARSCARLRPPGYPVHPHLGPQALCTP
ncbi:MAG: hypothetical protein AMXMBFR33_24770 [Candidatus Xenobia bacterium]